LTLPRAAVTWFAAASTPEAACSLELRGFRWTLVQCVRRRQPRTLRRLDLMIGRRSRYRSARVGLACGACLVLAGCHGMGAATISRDRFDYVSSISNSWKRQTLLNLVKVRYGDAPAFLDVSSVITSYSWEADVNLSSQLAPTGRGDTFVGLGANAHYADRPTITYSPLSGEQFARALLSSFPLTAILYLIESGYPGDVVLRFCVSSINGLDNEYGGPGNPRVGSPRFHELLTLFRANRTGPAIDMLLKKSKDKDALVLVLRPPETDEGRALHRRFRELLGLDSRASTFEVVHGPFASTPLEIAIQTRSMMQVLIDVGSYIEVPAAEVAEGRVYAPSQTPEQLRMYPALLQIHSGPAVPQDAHVAVRYRNGWFWIDDRDAWSKLAFNFVMMMFSITETSGSQQSAPIVTVPAR
jgi:hypothetical protein